MNDRPVVFSASTRDPDPVSNIRMATFLMTKDEINALAIAVARGVNPEEQPTDATEASAVVWRSAFARDTMVKLGIEASQEHLMLGPLMTMLAEGYLGL